MITIIGTDEAGYGPNLGALCVSGTRWQIARMDSESLPEQLRSELDPLCQKKGIFPVLDSKKLYHSSGSLAPLEKTILIALFLLNGKFPHELDCQQFFRRLATAFPPDHSKKSEIRKIEKNRQLTIFDSPDFEKECEPDPISDSVSDSVSDPGMKNFGQDPMSGEMPVWERDANFPLPTAMSLPIFDPMESVSPSCENSSENDLRNDALKARDYLRERAIRLDSVIARRIQPAIFNTRLAEGLLKSDILAETTLGIVRDLLPEFSNKSEILNKSEFLNNRNHKAEPDNSHTSIGTTRKNEAKNPAENDLNSAGAKTEKIYILCDKLGGRNNYRSLLAQFFPEYKRTTFSESRNISIYSMISNSDRQFPPLEIRFQMKGEANHPTALASIFSKYLRELSMIFFNDFWQRQIPDLLPTAGYPVDAKRFYNEIHEKQIALGISDFELWRNK